MISSFDTPPYGSVSEPARRRGRDEGFSFGNRFEGRVGGIVAETRVRLKNENYSYRIAENSVVNVTPRPCVV